MQWDRLTAFKKRVLRWNPEWINTGWEDLLLTEGLVHYAEAFGDPDAREWVDRWMVYHLGIPVTEEEFFIHSHTRNGEKIRGIKLYDYCGNWGAPLAVVPYLQSRGDAQDFAEPVIRVADFILEKSRKSADGTIYHGHDMVGFWVDTLYYSAVPLAKAYSLTGKEIYAREALKQCILHAKYLRDPLTGLFFHDFDPAEKRRTPGFWSRGNGWIIMSLAEVLRSTEEDTPHYEDLRELYLDLTAALLRMRHSSGLWRIVPENPDSHLETSGTAMIALAIAQGIEAGLLAPRMESVVLDSFHELQSWITLNEFDGAGAFMGSQLPAGAGGWESHKTVPMGETTYASGIFLKFLAQLKRMGMLDSRPLREGGWDGR